MANDYWNNLVALVRRTQVRAEAVNSILSAIKSGFDLFPSKTRLYEGRVGYSTDTGVANAYIVTPPYAVTLTDGAEVTFKALATNSGASVANVNALGNLPVVNYAGSALSGGEIVIDAFTTLRYNSTGASWRIVGPVTAVASVSVNNNVKVTSADTTPGPLNTKIVPYGLFTKATGSAAGDERLNIVPTSYTASGTDTYAATPAPAFTAYDGTCVLLVTFTNANTGAATINLNGLGAKALTKNGATALVAGDIAAAATKLLVYDGTQFQVLNVPSAPFALTNGGLKSTGFTAAVNTRYRCVFGAAGTITLPAAATADDVIVLYLAGNYVYTLNPNGLKINSSTASLLMFGNQTVVLTYGGATDGWG